jgi:hypothetical protein
MSKYGDSYVLHLGLSISLCNQYVLLHLIALGWNIASHKMHIEVTKQRVLELFFHSSTMTQ